MCIKNDSPFTRRHNRKWYNDSPALVGIGWRWWSGCWRCCWICCRCLTIGSGLCTNKSIHKWLVVSVSMVFGVSLLAVVRHDKPEITHQVYEFCIFKYLFLISNLCARCEQTCDTRSRTLTAGWSLRSKGHDNRCCDAAPTRDPNANRSFDIIHKRGDDEICSWWWYYMLLFFLYATFILVESFDYNFSR